VYLPAEYMDAQETLYGHAGVYATLGHEWGHWAQQQFGDTTRPLMQQELTSDCMSGSFLHAIYPKNDAILTLLQNRAVSMGDTSHGSGAARSRAYTTGWNTGNPLNCRGVDFSV
jgi:predicted metalloprotease